VREIRDWFRQYPDNHPLRSLVPEATAERSRSSSASVVASTIAAMEARNVRLVVRSGLRESVDDGVDGDDGKAGLAQGALEVSALETADE